MQIPKGTWRIASMSVNSDKNVLDDGYQHLVVSDRALRIEPIGIQFSVNQSTPKSAVLESRSQLFYADYFQVQDRLTIKLSRPAFAETIVLESVFEGLFCERQTA